MGPTIHITVMAHHTPINLLIMKGHFKSVSEQCALHFTHRVGCQAPFHHNKATHFSSKLLSVSPYLDMGLFDWFNLIWPKKHSQEVQHEPPSILCIL
jgi:hypothetical protein